MNDVELSPSHENGREAVGVLSQDPDVRAVFAVDRDAAPERDVADDRIAGNGPAALGEAQHHVADAVDRDAELRRGGRPAPRAGPRLHQVVGGSGRAVGGLALLEALHDLVDDDLRRDLRGAERDVELVALAEAHLADHVREQRRADDPLCGQPLLLEVVLQQLAAGVLGVLARLALEELPDLVSRAGRLDDREPVARRAALALGGQHLDDVARLQLVGERHDPPVDLRADAAVADVGVDLVGEVERRRAGGQRLDLALRREDEDLVLEQVDLQGVHELLGVRQLLLPVQEPSEPAQLAVVVGRLVGLVEPVRGDAELRHVVHLARADLDLQRPSLGPDDRGVKGLVHVELGHRDPVLEAAGQRLPQRVDDADGAVAVLHRVDDHAHRGEVVDLVELAALSRHLRVDRVEVLGAAGDLGVDAERVELAGEVGAGLVDVALALRALLVDEPLDLRVLARVQRREREVLELPLDRVDAEAVRDRGVDVEGLLRLLDLLLLRHRADGAHVVQAVGQLDQDDPDVRGHRDHHLAVVLRLRLVARGERQAGELRDAVDERRDLLAERRLHVLQRRRRVLHGVVEQRGAQRFGVEPHAGADLRHADWVDDELLARLAPLVGVVLAGVDERSFDLVAVDLQRALGGVLLDDREQVAEQLALGVGEAGAGHGRGRHGMVDPVDGQPVLVGARVQRDAARRLRHARAGTSGVVAVAVSVSHLRPSSYRCIAAR